MCGICGLVDFERDATDSARVERMVGSLSHRGPDDRGTMVMGPAVLGHTRLSIIDLTDAGHQPMLAVDADVCLVFNGEIFNFPELRRELESGGARFRSRSDTEVVLEAYRAWGTAAFARLNGMFALAIWDNRAGELHLARDRFGIKPLYYRPSFSGIVFGSEVKSIRAAEPGVWSIDEQALHEYFWYGNALAQHTLFSEVRRLAPGHFLTLGIGGSRITAFWRIEDLEPELDVTADEAACGVRELLENSVRRHLLSDVPVGVFLSGGIDSSAITAFASRHYGGRLSTYSVGFDFQRFTNELPVAREVARRFGTDHHEIHVSGTNLPDVIEELVRCHDEPFADAANIPLFLLCRQLRSQVKVVLQGDGGDELFAGYRRYSVLARESSWRLASHAAAFALGLRARSAADHRHLRFADALRHHDPAMRMALLLTQEHLREPPTRVLHPELRAQLEIRDPFAAYRAQHARFAGLDPVQRMLFTDFSVLLPNTFLEKVDKSTMAHGVEVRVPFLENELAAYAMRLPSRLKVRGGQKKWILRRALRGVLPDAILDGVKAGFGVPYEDWLRGPLADYMRSVLQDPSVVSARLFDSVVLGQCMDEHISGRRDRGFLLWKCLHFALWHREYFPTR